MSISSFVAAKIVGELTEWSVERTRIHKLLYMMQLVYAYRNNGKSFISNEPFISDDVGPVLKDLDQRIAGFGARKYRNLFRQHQYFTNELEDEIKLIKDTIEHYKDTSTATLGSIARGFSWSKYYNQGELKYIMEQTSIHSESIFLLSKKRQIKLLNTEFSFPVVSDDLIFIEIVKETAIPYNITDSEKRIIESLLEIFAGNIKFNYIPIQGRDSFYLKDLDRLSDVLIKFLAYKSEEHQNIFMYEYLNGNI